MARSDRTQEARSKQEAWRLPQPSARSPALSRSNSEAVGGLTPLGGGAGQAPGSHALSCGPWLLGLLGSERRVVQLSQI